MKSSAVLQSGASRIEAAFLRSFEQLLKRSEERRDLYRRLGLARGSKLLLASRSPECLREAAESASDEVHSDTVLEAILYSFLGGKALRGTLFLLLSEALLSGELLDRKVNADPALREAFAAAIEMIQSYSLVHDDLPSFDNDLLRRGKPSCHARYGECCAILAGDALLNLAYETVLGAASAADDSAAYAEALAAIAHSAGAVEMILGQAEDVYLERQSTGKERAILDAEGAAVLREERIQAVLQTELHKTADFMVAALLAAAKLHAAPPIVQEEIQAFAYPLGLAFQLQDDLLDLEGDSALLGKTTGKDAAVGKQTLCELLGKEEAERQLCRLFSVAEGHLDRLEEAGLEIEALRALFAWLRQRKR